MEVRSDKLLSKQTGYYIYYNKYFKTDYDGIEYTKEMIIEILKNAKDIMSSLKFDRINGELKEKEELKLSNDDIEFFGTDDNECCVCKEKTLTKTLCQHTLCYMCWETIYKNKKPKCPLCRNSIKYCEDDDDCESECDDE